MKFVYICTPYDGDANYNAKLQKAASKSAAMLEVVPLVPQLAFAPFMGGEDKAQRQLALWLRRESLRFCKELWVCAPEITPEMQGEIDLATRVGMTVRNKARDITCYFEPEPEKLAPEMEVAQ